MAVYNPTSVLTRPNDTTPYGAGDLIASNTTPGSIVVPFAASPNVANLNGLLRRARLTSNVTTGWGSVVLTIDLWAAAPTFTNGDNGAYAVATGAANWLGSMTVTLAQLADGAVGIATPDAGSEVGIGLTASQKVYWTLKIVTGTPTPIANQTFTLTPEIVL